MSTGEFIAWVAVAVTATVLVAIGTTAWNRRRLVLDWTASGKQAIERRLQRIRAARHEELVSWVIQRAEVVQIEVPVAVSHVGGYAAVDYHPTGAQSFFVADFQHYQSLLKGGQLPPSRTFWNRPIPRPVPQWSDDELRDWLLKHADLLPPT